MSRFILRPLRPKVSENDVRTACLQVLRLRGYWPVRQHVGKFKTVHGNWISVGEPGDPDYAVLTAPGFFLETKRPGNDLSPAQIARIRDLEVLCGLKTVVVGDVEQLIEWLDRIAPVRGP
jgi:hypothetical protein